MALIRCHQFSANITIDLEARECQAMRGDEGAERFGKLMAAVKRATHGWCSELRVNWVNARITATIAAPKHLDLDKFVDEVRLRVRLAMYASGIRERDPGRESALEMLLERTVQPKDPPQAAESAPASA